VPEPEFLSTREVADLLGVSPETVKKLVRGGGLEAFRIGSRIRIRRTALDAFIEAARIKPGELEIASSPPDSDG
jgi:excisionase family DNA binding protein